MLEKELARGKRGEEELLEIDAMIRRKRELVRKLELCISPPLVDIESAFPASTTSDSHHFNYNATQSKQRRKGKREKLKKRKKDQVAENSKCMICKHYLVLPVNSKLL